VGERIRWQWIRVTLPDILCGFQEMYALCCGTTYRWKDHVGVIEEIQPENIL
jgi:hypothetical protein